MQVCQIFTPFSNKCFLSKYSVTLIIISFDLIILCGLYYTTLLWLWFWPKDQQWIEMDSTLFILLQYRTLIYHCCAWLCQPSTRKHQKLASTSCPLNTLCLTHPCINFFVFWGSSKWKVQTYCIFFPQLLYKLKLEWETRTTRQKQLTQSSY